MRVAILVNIFHRKVVKTSFSGEGQTTQWKERHEKARKRASNR